MVRPLNNNGINKHKPPVCPEDKEPVEWTLICEAYPERSQIYAIVDENNWGTLTEYKKKRDHGNWISPYSKKKVVAWLKIPQWYPRAK